jgi:RNA polymerase sigma factor (sigma-70 family)
MREVSREERMKELDLRILALLREMQSLEPEARTDVFGKVLEAEGGPWQHKDAKTPQSLRKFALDAATKAINNFGLRKHARMRADDLSQELLLCLFQNVGKIREIEKIRGWINAVAVQLVKHYVSEHAATEFAPDFDALTPSADGPGPGESVAPADRPHVVTREDVRNFRKLTKSLTPDERRALRHRYLRDLSDSGVAHEMKKKEPATRQQLSRAQRKLKKRLLKEQTSPKERPRAKVATRPDDPDNES